VLGFCIAIQRYHTKTFSVIFRLSKIRETITNFDNRSCLKALHVHNRSNYEIKKKRQSVEIPLSEGFIILGDSIYE